METNTKHAGGRPPKFKTPEELQDKAEEYFQYCDTHPIEVWQRKAAAASRSFMASVSSASSPEKNRGKPPTAWERLKPARKKPVPRKASATVPA